MAVRLATVAALTLLAASGAAAQSFRGLGFSDPGATTSVSRGISDDGRAVTGSGTGGFSWSASTGFIGLPGENGFTFSGVPGGASENGRFVAGTSEGGGIQRRAVRWTVGTGAASLQVLPADPAQSNIALATDVSANGNVIVGQYRTQIQGPTTLETTFVPARWVGGSLEPLAMNASEYRTGRAVAVSRDGSVAVGDVDPRSGGTVAARWGGGGLTVLGTLPGGTLSTATDVDATGAHVVGWSIGGGIRNAFRWTPAGGMVGLGWPAGFSTSEATTVSADGSVVGGRLNNFFAALWTEEHGWRLLRDLLVERGLGEQIEGWQLTWISAISADGQTIAGQGINPTGQTEAFVASLTGVPEIVVNDARDLPDADPDDEVCDVDLAEGGLQCTLRAALQTANADEGEQAVAIGFDLDGEGPHVIALGSLLPTIARPVEIDGTTEPDYAPATDDTPAMPSVFITGSAGARRGVVVAADSSLVRGLGFGGFDIAALDISPSAGAGPHRVEACWFGLNEAGSGTTPNAVGLRVREASGVVLGGAAEAQRNVFAAHTVAAVQTTGTGLTIRGNGFGVTPDGTAALPDAVAIESIGSTGLVVEGNTILGVQAGVRLTGEENAPTVGARVVGNVLGLLPSNQIPPAGPSTGFGVLVENATDTVVGGAAEETGRAPGNVIAGWNTGVFVAGGENGRGVGTRIAGNLIGTDTTGTAARPNAAGVGIVGRAADTRVGGWAPGERNVISGSTAASGRGVGVAVTAGDGTVFTGEPTGTVVAGNFIGTDVTGTEEIGHQRWGVYVGPFPSGGTGGVSDVTIGATAGQSGGAPAALRRNVILGAGEANVRIDRAGAASGAPVRVVGNHIGLDAAGNGGIDQSTVGSATRAGVWVSGTARATVGGAGDDGNTVGGHRVGIWMDADGGHVVGNRIGTDPPGLLRRANLIGVGVSGPGVSVGVAPDGSALGNVISGNILAGPNSSTETQGVGLVVASRSLIEAFLTDGTAARVAPALHDPGDAHARRRAPVSSAVRHGDDPPVTGAVVAHNLIGTTAAGDAPVVPNDERNRTYGVWVSWGAVDTQVYANTISGNGRGLAISPTTNADGRTDVPTGTRVAGNRLGLAAATDALVPNRVWSLGASGAPGTVIGAEAVAGQGANLITGTGTEGSGLPPFVFAPGVLLIHPDDAPDGWPAGQVTLRQNRIWGNEGLAITYDPDLGVTPNDPGNTDGVASFDQPVLYQAVDDGSALAVVGTTNGPMTVEVFADRPCDALGHGEGRLYLGTLTSSPEGAFAGTVGRPPFSDWRISATGTNVNGTTSEMSRCTAVSAPGEAVAFAVGPGQTPTVDGPGVTVTVTTNPFAPGDDARRAEGTLYVARHEGAADDGAFEGAATSGDGTTVTPDGVQRQQFWSVLADGLDGITYEACLRYDGLFSLPVPGQIVVVTRSSRGEAWTPHASALRTAGGASYVCAGGLTAFGEVAIGADMAVNPVPTPEAPEAPAAFALAAWPNPSPGAVTLSVSVPEASGVRVEAFDALGRRVATVHDGSLGAGVHGLRLAGLSPGVYVVRASSGTDVAVQRLTVVR